MSQLINRVANEGIVVVVPIGNDSSVHVGPLAAADFAITVAPPGIKIR